METDQWNFESHDGQALPYPIGHLHLGRDGGDTVRVLFTPNGVQLRVPAECIGRTVIIVHKPEDM